MMNPEGPWQGLNPVDSMLQVQLLQDGEELLSGPLSPPIGPRPMGLAIGVVDAQS